MKTTNQRLLMTFLAAIAFMVNGLAQDVISVEINSSTGSKTQGNGNVLAADNGGYFKTWTSTQTTPQLTLFCGVKGASSGNQMAMTSAYTRLHAAASNAANSLYLYTLEVPAGYKITGYDMKFKGQSADAITVTPAGGGDAVTSTSSTAEVSLSVDNISAQTTTFTIVSSAVRYIEFSKFTVYIAEDSGSEGIDTEAYYSIDNANGRGSLYYSPTRSSRWVWSTGKNNDAVDADNKLWVFVPTGQPNEYYIYNVGRQRFIEPVSGGDYNGQTWAFTSNRVACTLTQLDNGTWTIRKTEGNVYLSVSNTFNGPIISYYSATDAGVPFTFSKMGTVTDKVRDEIEHAGDVLLKSDITVKQGYHTCGRGNKRELLLLVTLPAATNQQITLNNFTFQLKGNTLKNVNKVSLYRTSTLEFYSLSSPSLISSVTPETDEVVLPVNKNLLSVNNYWLAVDVNDDATLEEVLDAKLLSISYTVEDKEVVLDVASVGDPAHGAKVFATRSFAFVPTTNSCRFYRIPAMIVAENGNLVAAIDKRYSSNADLGVHRIDVAVRRSSDGGRTWTSMKTIATGDGSSMEAYGYGDAALALAPSGRILCVMAAGKNGYFSGMRYIGMTYSDDNGLTWSKVSNLTTGKFTDAMHSTEGSIGFWSIFATSGKGLTTKDGVVMFPSNCIDVETNKTSDCYILSTADNGETWTLGPTRAYSGTNESKLEQRNDGSLLLSVRQGGNRGFNTGSADATEWGTQYRTGELWGADCNADILCYSRSTEGKQDIMLHTMLNSGARENLCMYVSTNEGKNWRQVMNIQPGGAAYSTMVKMPDGSVGILYEDESYSAGNGYAINFVSLTPEQISSFAPSTGIETVSSSFVTSHSSSVYDLQGRNVGTSTACLPAGIYIVGGKKVVVK